uniref:Peptidase A2 domain-containing protein n=1 Tax=Peronospora matthiolae TaxID=2874970 RepID=A0AAV1T703_9STRA
MQTTVSSKNKYPRFEEESSDSDSDSNSEMKLVGLVAKKHTSTKLAPLRIKVQLKNANINFEALLDSGASMSIINQKNLQANVQLGRKKVASSTKFQTENGEVTSDGSAVIQFRFASLKPSAIITHRFEILEKSQDAIRLIGTSLRHWALCSISKKMLFSGMATTRTLIPVCHALSR